MSLPDRIRTARSTVRRRYSPRFLRTLFEQTTSCNAESEILKVFDIVEPSFAARNLCAFYQGCGADLITLACHAVHTHILSDCDESLRARITEKLRELKDADEIADLVESDKSWTFQRNGFDKRLIFTQRPIDEINFEQLSGVHLGMVFEYNPGDSASKRSFWTTVAQELVAGGFVVGSYAESVERADRAAFTVTLVDERLCVCGVVDDRERDVRLERDTLEQASAAGQLPEELLGKTVVERDGKLFRLTRLFDPQKVPEAIRDHYKSLERQFDISGIWSTPLDDFGLKEVWRGKTIIVLKKR